MTSRRRSALSPDLPDREPDLSPKAWFGTQVGTSLWLLAAAFLYLPESPALGSALLTAFLLTNALGSCLWLLGETRPVRPLFLAMLAGHGAASVGALLAIAAASRLDALQAWGHGLSPWLYASAFPLVITVLALAWRSASARNVPGRG